MYPTNNPHLERQLTAAELERLGVAMQRDQVIAASDLVETALTRQYAAPTRAESTIHLATVAAQAVAPNNPINMERPDNADANWQPELMASIRQQIEDIHRG